MPKAREGEGGQCLNSPASTMPDRNQFLTEFIDALAAAAGAAPTAGVKGRIAVDRIFSMLTEPRTTGSGQSIQLEACRHLDRALANARRGPEAVARLADTFAPLARSLHWRLRPPEEGEDPAFRDGHANADVIGPSGLERHDDIVVGATLLAPGVTFPNHRHPPEEVYVVMSEGDWFNGDAGWHTPGVGGLIYHRPEIVHAMRSGQEPLLAFWCLHRP